MKTTHRTRNSLTFLITGLLAGLFPSLSLGQGSYTAWSGHRDIVLNTSATGANVTGNVTKFPVLVRLDFLSIPASCRLCCHQWR
jgi:hypothetical protein